MNSVITVFARNAVSCQIVFARKNAIIGGTPDTSTPLNRPTLTAEKCESKA